MVKRQRKHLFNYIHAFHPKTSWITFIFQNSWFPVCSCNSQLIPSISTSWCHCCLLFIVWLNSLTLTLLISSHFLKENRHLIPENSQNMYSSWQYQDFIIFQSFLNIESLIPILMMLSHFTKTIDQSRALYLTLDYSIFMHLSMCTTRLNQGLNLQKQSSMHYKNLHQMSASNKW